MKKILLLMLLVIPLTAANFNVEPELFDLVLDRGENFNAVLDIYNYGSTEKTYLITYTENLLNAPPLSVTIGPGKSKRMVIDVDAERMDVGTHHASIFVSDGVEKKEVTLRVKVREDRENLDAYAPEIIMVVLFFILVLEAFYMVDVWKRSAD